MLITKYAGWEMFCKSFPPFQSFKWSKLERDYNIPVTIMLILQRWKTVAGHKIRKTCLVFDFTDLAWKFLFKLEAIDFTRWTKNIADTFFQMYTVVL